MVSNGRVVALVNELADVILLTETDLAATLNAAEAAKNTGEDTTALD